MMQTSKPMSGNVQNKICTTDILGRCSWQVCKKNINEMMQGHTTFKIMQVN